MQIRDIRRTRCLVSLLLIGIGGSCQAAWATTFTVGAGKTFPTPEQIDWHDVRPGDTVVIYPGTYPSTLGTGNSMSLAGVVGTSSKPITVMGLSAAAQPVLDSGVNITGGSAYVKISNLDVSRNPSTQRYAAVVVQGGSNHIVLAKLAVHDSFVGVEFNGAGLQNTLEISRVYSNVMSGITAAAPGTAFIPDTNHRSWIISNQIYANGSHGIEITGPFWNVEHNRIWQNGAGVHGTSGVHLYSVTDKSGNYTCNDAQISYNYVSAQQDTDGTDGNGIQIDDFCDSNTVSFNVVWDNAGAGISVLDSADNSIFSNTSYSNATDTGRAVKYPGVFRGEIILGSMANLCANPNVIPSACHVPAGSSSGNRVYNNLVVSAYGNVPGIMVSPDAVTNNTNYLSPNMYYNLSSNGVELLWNQVRYYTASTIDVVTPDVQKGVGSIVQAASFVKPSDPVDNGLKLSKQPENQGQIVQGAAVDMVGVLPQSGTSYYGAYYTTP